MEKLLSQRAYARRRNVSEAAVRRHVKSGALAGATKNGKLDPGKADKLWRDRVKPPRVPRSRTPSLADANRRKQLAAIGLLAQKNDSDRAKLIPAAALDDFEKRLFKIFRTALDRFPGMVARHVAGLPVDCAMSYLNVSCECLWWDLKRGCDELVAEWKALPEKQKRHTRLPDLSQKTDTELAAIKAGLTAERYTVLKQKGAGELVEMPKTFFAWVNAATLAQQAARWFFGATNCAPRFEKATVQESDKILHQHMQRIFSVVENWRSAPGVDAMYETLHDGLG